MCSKMAKLIALASMTGLVAAQAPPQPVWPTEFFAEIDERDLAHNNRSTLYRQAYSFSNDAEKCVSPVHRNAGA